VLLGNRGGQNLYDIMASMKAIRPDLRIIVTGSGMDDESVLKAIAAGAKGYVDEAASAAEFIQALRIVNQAQCGRLAACFRLSSNASAHPPAASSRRRITFTDREKEVLEMLVAGRSNKEIGSASASKSARSRRTWPNSCARSEYRTHRAVGACDYAFAGDGKVVAATDARLSCAP